MRVPLRGEDHPEGPLVIRRTREGKLVLDDTHVDIVSLGEDDADALLVAKCIRYMANWDPEANEASEATLETLLRTIVAEHRMRKQGLIP